MTEIKVEGCCCVECRVPMIELDYGRVYMCESCGIDMRKWPNRKTLETAIELYWPKLARTYA